MAMPGLAADTAHPTIGTGRRTGVRPGCPMADLLAMLGQPHMLDLLSALLRSKGRPMRFTQMQNQLSLSPKTLAHRLRTLVEAGIVVRRAYSEIPPRVEYEITEKGAEVRELFDVLERWRERNTLRAVPVVTTVGTVPRYPRGT